MEGAVEINEKDQHLGHSAVLIKPFEAWRKLSASTTYWVKRDGLASIERVDLLHDRVEIENIDALRSLTLEDRLDLGLEEPQLT